MICAIPLNNTPLYIYMFLVNGQSYMKDKQNIEKRNQKRFLIFSTIHQNHSPHIVLCSDIKYAVIKYETFTNKAELFNMFKFYIF